MPHPIHQDQEATKQQGLFDQERRWEGEPFKSATLQVLIVVFGAQGMCGQMTHIVYGGGTMPLLKQTSS